MENITQSKWFIPAVVVGILVILIIGVLVGMSFTSSKTATNPDGSPLDDAGVVTGPTSDTVSEVPDNIRIPEAGEEQKGDTAVPDLVTSAAPGVEAKFRGFNVVISKGGFSPGEIVARQGDTVKITFSTSDGSYDVVQPDYGFKTRVINPGETQILEFGATTPGKYTFFCGSCGGPDDGPVGHFVVVPKE